jgi:hypothetical protein
MFDHNSYAELPAISWKTLGDYQQWAMAYFVSRGLTAAQSAAIVGNLTQESGMNPAATRANDAGPGLDSEGVGQWNRKRLASMTGFVHSVVGQTATVQSQFYAQLAFVVHELYTTEAKARQVLMETEPQDETLAGVFGKLYEGFSTASVPARNQHAKDILAAYDPKKWT